MDLPKPLTCSEVGRRSVLKKLLSHEMEGDLEDRVLAHLRKCPSCLSLMAEVLGETVLPGFVDDDLPRFDELGN